MKEPNDTTVLGNFNNVILTFNGITSRLFKEGGKYMVNTRGEDGVYHDYEVAYTFGVTPLQNYLVKFPKGRLQVLRLTWDSEKNEWYNMHKDMHLEDGEWLNWTGGAGNWNTMCADCHSLNVQQNFFSEEDSFHTTFEEINVTCESCHGPGSAHVAWIEHQAYKDSSNLFPGHLLHQTAVITSQEQVNQCAPCHSRRQTLGQHQFDSAMMNAYLPDILREGLYHADGQINDEVYVYGSFTQSKMYHNDVRCSDCHNPHSLKLKREGNLLCTSCHSSNTYDVQAHHFHEMNTEGAACVSCHMPGKTYMEVDFRRDHSFRIPRPDLSADYDTPNACNDCHSEKTAQWAAKQVEEWHGKERPYHYSEALAKGRNATEDALPALIDLVRRKDQPAIARATAIYYLSSMPQEEAIKTVMSALADEEPLVRYWAVESMTAYSEQDRIAYLLPLTKDSTKAVRIAVARSLTGIPLQRIPKNYQGLLKDTQEEYQQQLAVNAGLRGGQFNIGQYHMRIGETQQAIKAMERTLAMDSLFGMASMNLAILYNRENRNTEALKLLRLLVKQNPQYGEGYFNLALLLAETEEYEEAMLALQNAALYMPDNPRVFYNWGLIQQKLGAYQEASNTFQKGLQTAPYDEALHQARLQLLLQLNQRQEARTHLDFLLKRYPNDTYLQNLSRSL
ncbi:multiheme c-type cytochrome [Algivirga pacifica]|uniref:Multiheme c-type cytochrome n=2 Tax=Algivirga pacifica TaxID=1162670 RepID=A0ABP9DJ02_9BACT